MTTNEKNELISRLQSATGLSADDKAALTRLLRTQQYGLVWEEKPEDVEELLRTQMPVLTEVKEKTIISEAADAPDHILIEGDNLEALNALAYTHEGKIDVIYIDPPYNTGNKDFVYNDSFVDSEDGYRHSKWLSFMDKRLRLAKRLLSEKGVIFISIDDNEQANLKLLCDKVFGENQQIAIVIPVCNPGGRDYKQIAVQHEYLLVYGTTDSSELNEIEKEAQFDCVDKNGGYELRELRNRNPKFHRGNRPNLFYPFYVNPTIKNNYGCCKVSLEKTKEFNVEVCPYNSIGIESVWRWGKPKASLNLNDDIELSEIVAKQKKDGGWNIYEKSRKQTTKAKSIWDETEMRTEEGTRLVRAIFGVTVFDHPKSLSLLLRCLQLGTSDYSTILDFFAGSGTTLHATMQLNAEDGGHRQCILVTNNENNICEEVTYERNLRVIQGYTNAKGQQVEGLTNNSLRYYRVEHVARQNDNRTLRELMEKSTDLLCIKEGIYREEREFAGLKFKPSVARYFHEGERRMLIIYNELAVAPIAARVAECGATKEHPLKVYVFSPGRYAYEDELHAVATLVEVCAMPEALLQSMQSTLPPLHYGEEDYTPDAEAAAEALADNYNYKEEGGEA